MKLKLKYLKKITNVDENEMVIKMKLLSIDKYNEKYKLIFIKKEKEENKIKILIRCERIFNGYELAEYIYNKIIINNDFDIDFIIKKLSFDIIK
jgi:hypothetical protein